MDAKDLKQHYDNLWQQAVARFTQHTFELDKRIDDPNDQRLGITLLLRPTPAIAARVLEFLEVLRTVEPYQYYYPASDLHLTVMSVISCRTGFLLAQIDPAAYAEVIREALQGVQAFEITLEGITASPSCVLLQGYPHDQTLQQVRDNLRACFSKTNLMQSIDQRYTILTAHSTVARFRRPVQQPEQLLEILYAYREVFFGTFAVNTLELVFNDWYQRHHVVQTLATFDLPEKASL